LERWETSGTLLIKLSNFSLVIISFLIQERLDDKKEVFQFSLVSRIFLFIENLFSHLDNETRTNQSTQEKIQKSNFYNWKLHMFQTMEINVL
jgi:hypothetical protein